MLKKISLLVLVMMLFSFSQAFAFGVLEDGVEEGHAADLECGAGIDCTLGAGNKVTIDLGDSPVLSQMQDYVADSGWTVESGSNTQCKTTCGTSKLCLFGFDTASGVVPTPCDDATADTCVCA